MERVISHKEEVTNKLKIKVFETEKANDLLKERMINLEETLTRCSNNKNYEIEID